MTTPPESDASSLLINDASGVHYGKTARDSQTRNTWVPCHLADLCAKSVAGEFPRILVRTRLSLPINTWQGGAWRGFPGMARRCQAICPADAGGHLSSSGSWGLHCESVSLGFLSRRCINVSMTFLVAAATAGNTDAVAVEAARHGPWWERAITKNNIDFFDRDTGFF